MKTFSFFSPFVAGAMIAVLSGCAATGASSQVDAKAPMMDKDGCSCCAMHNGQMSQGISDKSMGMMQGNSSAPQGGMCSAGKDGKATSKGGCACCNNMAKMGRAGSADGTCDMDMKDMSPEMHKRHMEMMQQHHPEMAPGKTAPPPMAK